MSMAIRTVSEDAEATVALIEAGGSDRTSQLQMPAALAYPLAGDKYLWRYSTAPEPSLGQRVVVHPRGGVLGSTSSITGMMYVQGPARF